MRRSIRFRPAAPIAGILMALAVPAGALAHHGWGWTADEESRLEGEITAISLGNPHAHLEVEAEDGTWEVDLAPPYATQRAGFVEGVAKAGDRASFTGHRSRTDGEKLFKAETITVGGKTYDVYPNRTKSLKPEG
ncbi:DUF6152 family protein [Aurantimonas sp. 22II-16-19i]|uniref:DUF6152 family protein n=1 Tax=Aurantimonas sp. 22II-16-19i TaxID=1317114 RepID=UPI0009F7F924|nr:DUF6152 family protein [Aurantimonas sp. 22II-16-19i]ORE94830.1 hypothetical protein ATO4_14259 [Aurantimonas sp. 22II-16-19i]